MSIPINEMYKNPDHHNMYCFFCCCFLTQQSPYRRVFNFYKFDVLWLKDQF